MKPRFINFFIFILITGNSYAQGFLITPPRLTFDGYRLLISYDLISKDPSDIFFIWVEMLNKNGESLNIKALSGDVGEKISSGKSKRISWIPEKDNIFLNEEVTVEVKAEKYNKSYNKVAAMLMSAAVPGLGQTRISKGKPWWLTGVAAYGAAVGGIVMHKSSMAAFDSYNAEKEDPVVRAELYDQYTKKANISNAFLISGAVVWITNIIWVAGAPNPYQPIQRIALSVNRSPEIGQSTAMLTLRINF